MSSISIGHTLSGRYEVKSVIGQGGFGITYEAEHMLLKSKVCIKELYISGLNTRTLDETLSVDFHQKDSYQKSIRRFIEEAQKLQQFSHPNIVQVSDLFEDNNTAYMVMELIEGENLKQYVKRKGVLEWLEAEKITKQLLDAVEQLHSKGLLHLDIKPENILIDQQGKITLIDFGSAKEFVSEKTHGSTAVMLTQGYAPIEQYHSRDKRKPTIDIYAIGATLYYLLTGEKPISAPERIDEQLKEPHTYNNVTISTQVSSAIMLAMQMRPMDRFQNIKVFKKALIDMNHFLNENLEISSSKEIDITPKSKIENSKKNEFKKQLLKTKKQIELKVRSTTKTLKNNLVKTTEKKKKEISRKISIDVSWSKIRKREKTVFVFVLIYTLTMYTIINTVEIGGFRYFEFNPFDENIARVGNTYFFLGAILLAYFIRPIFLFFSFLKSRFEMRYGAINLATLFSKISTKEKIVFIVVLVYTQIMYMIIDAVEVDGFRYIEFNPFDENTARVGNTYLFFGGIILAYIIRPLYISCRKFKKN